ncbi:MAG: hypothetical protein ACREOZ_04630 [Gloeomargaritales cyanobacterium]
MSPSRSRAPPPRPETLVNCPVPTCRHLLPYKNIAALREHLENHTKADIFERTPAELATSGLVRCFECRHKPVVYCSEAILRNHINHNHKHSRDKLNSQLAKENISRNNSTSEEQWNKQLSWLSLIEYNPMPFRYSLWSRLGKSSKTAALDVLREVVSVYNLSSASVSDGEDLPIFEASKTPFFNLLCLFERSYLDPKAQGRLVVTTR